MDVYVYYRLSYFKGTLMQIWKSPYMFVFIWKYNPENSAFWILIILELFTRKVRIFVKGTLMQTWKSP